MTPRTVRVLDIADTTPNTIASYWLHIINNDLGEAVRIPILVARGRREGPVLGLTAAIHGNELNGIPVIQHLFENLDLDNLCGTIVGVLVVNVPGLERRQRVFNDGADLNRIAPGRADGNTSQLYIHRIIDRILSKFDYHIDLHTASAGRVNSYYIRADMADPETASLAKLQNAEIIVDNPPGDGTLRGAASDHGIKSITVELRDPGVFQGGVIRDSLVGIRNVIHHLKMLPGPLLCPIKQTTLCSRSYWLYTDEGGILRVLPKITERVQKGQLVAEVRTIFGELTKQYFAPEDGIVVGRSVDPLNQTGSRILHLGTNPRTIACLLDEDVQAD